MNVWSVVLAVGLGTLLFRLSMVAFADRIVLPARFDRASALVAPAAFAALATTSVATSCLGVGAVQAAPKLVAVAVAVAAVVRTGSASAAVLAGMPALWLTTALLTHLAPGP